MGMPEGIKLEKRCLLCGKIRKGKLNGNYCRGCRPNQIRSYAKSQMEKE